MSTWPIIAKNLVDQPTLDRLSAIFEEGMEAGVDGGRKTYHFKQLIAAGRLDIAERAVQAFCQGQADAVARQVFGGDYVFLLAACVYRCHEPYRRDTHLGLHFDANVFGQDALVVNFWVPFDTVGDRAPGLTYIKSDIDVSPLVEQWRRSRLEPQGENGAGPKIRFSLEEVETALGRPADDILFTPKLEPGDASIFHQFVIHATQLVDVDEQPRRSFEMRICAANKIPHAYLEKGDPIVISRRAASGAPELEYRARATASA